jgi:hypothetical protein
MRALIEYPTFNLGLEDPSSRLQHLFSIILSRILSGYRRYPLRTPPVPASANNTQPSTPPLPSTKHHLSQRTSSPLLHTQIAHRHLQHQTAQALNLKIIRKRLPKITLFLLGKGNSRKQGNASQSLSSRRDPLRKTAAASSQVFVTLHSRVSNAMPRGSNKSSKKLLLPASLNKSRHSCTLHPQSNQFCDVPVRNTPDIQPNALENGFSDRQTIIIKNNHNINAHISSEQLLRF